MAKESQVLVLLDMNEIKRDIAEQLNIHLNSCITIKLLRNKLSIFKKHLFYSKN